MHFQNAGINRMNKHSHTTPPSPPQPPLVNTLQKYLLEIIVNTLERANNLNALIEIQNSVSKTKIGAVAT